jgi:hypothetical protein
MGVLSQLFATKETDSTRFDRLEAKVRDLDDILTKQGKALKSIELDWEQTYDKMAHLMARITKRRAALEREQAQGDGQQTPETPNAERGGGGSHRIIGTHDDLQEMRRRNGLLPR